MDNSCSTTVCGTGEWDGPAPGDPSTDVVLTATATYGGIQVVWGYPTTNPHAVAHTLLYRSTSGNVATAVELAVVSGSTYFDRIATEGNYFYWIKIVSVNGTVGAFVGPASATARNRGEDTVADLIGKIAADTLSENLKKDVLKITQTSEELRQEILDRIAANNALQGIVGGLQTDLEDAITYMGTESIERREGASAIVGEMLLIAAANAENAAAITEERTARVDALSAVVTDVTTLQAATEDYAIALQEEATIRAEETGALFAEKYVKIDLAGNVSGYGLSARVDPDGSTSNFRVSADKFSISSPNYVGTTAPPANMRHQGKVWIDTTAGEGNEVVRWWNAGTNAWSLVPIESAQPFVYYASPTTLSDGTIIQPGLYVNSALITKLRADQIDTRGLTIRDAVGNIIFGSGTGLDWGSIGGTNKPQDGATRNVFRGNWVTGSAYAVGDTVMDVGNGWSAKVAHDAVAGNRPPASGVGNTWWAAYTVKGDAGSNGLDGLTVVAPNSSHTLPASSDGAVSSYTGSGTTIEVFDGSTAVNAVATITGNNQFTVGTPVVTGTSTISPGARTYSGTVATVAQHGTMSTAGTISILTYPITVRRSNGTNVNLSFKQTLTKSLAGTNGTNGAAGQGQVKGIAFLRSATNPGTPSVTGTYADPKPTGWSDGIPAGTLPLWQTTRIFTSDGAAPQQSAWTAPSMVANTSSVKYQFSTNNTIWNDSASVDSVYIRTGTSTDGGTTWAFSAGVKIKGEQGPKGDSGTQGIPGTPGTNGVTLYTWIKYADSPTTGISDFPSGKAYIGVAYNKTTATESVAYADYSWSLIKGDQGIQGNVGTPGQTTYTWIKYADSSSGTGMSDSPTNKTHIGIAVNKTTNVESADAADYTWALIQGPKGDTGTQGIQGPVGPQGQATYTWVKYADTPTTGISDFPSGKKYLGIAYNKITATESETYSDYSWALIQGEQGQQGPTGLQGQTTYTWIKYADNATGTTGLSDSATGKKYIGIAPNKLTSVESTIPGDYTWALIQGPQGEVGDTGPAGPALVLLVSRTPSFTATDGVLDVGQPNIVFTATLEGDIDPGTATYAWTVTGTQTQPALGNTASITLTAAQFGVATSAIVQCTVSGISDQVAVHRLNKSTAAAGATVGADGSNLKTGLGVNMVFNGDYTDGAAGTYAGYYTTGSAPLIGHNLASHTLQGEGTAYVYLTTTPAANSVFDADVVNGAAGKLFPVQAGKRYEVSAWFNSHRCSGAASVLFYNSSGGQISQSFANSIAYQSGISSMADLRQSWGIFTAPVGAVSAKVILRATATGAATPYLFFSRVYFGEAGAVQTEASAWSPGRGISQITPGNASTYIADASIAKAQMGVASIGSAQIESAAVDTLKVAGNAITAASTASVSISAGTDVTRYSNAVVYSAPANTAITVLVIVTGRTGSSSGSTNNLRRLLLRWGFGTDSSAHTELLDTGQSPWIGDFFSMSALVTIPANEFRYFSICMENPSQNTTGMTANINFFAAKR